jgi:HEAT repeat protein
MNEIEQAIQAVEKGSARAAERLGWIESESPGGLGALRGKAIAALVEALANPSGSVRFEAAWALASFQVGTACAIPSLVKLLRDQDPQISSQAAETLERFGVTPEFLPELIDALGADDPGTRGGVADALATLGREAKDAVPALTVSLADMDFHVRKSAARALGGIGAASAPAIPLLFQLAVAASAPADAEAQTDYLGAMANICQESPPAVQMLRKLLEESGDQRRGFLRVALRRMAGLE